MPGGSGCALILGGAIFFIRFTVNLFVIFRFDAVLADCDDDDPTSLLFDGIDVVIIVLFFTGDGPFV